ncbi:MAG: response regulator [Gammaproteobacteria bacterium]|nr:response regulator [Gammaproteobacteria bacterium]
MSADSILLVEDEPEIREMLSFSLVRAGFEVIEADSAETALARLQGTPPKLLIIDWRLPGMSGVDLVRRLRRDPATSELPLIMLTARGEESDKLTGFDAGIDDYVVKPFSPRELIARVKSLLRRAGNPADGKMAAGPIEVDTRAHRVTVEGTRVAVGPLEFRLLEQLMRWPDRAFDRAQLLDRVWGRNIFVEERTVDVHILRLRKALAPFGADRCIETVRGIGYRFVAEESEWGARDDE